MQLRTARTAAASRSREHRAPAGRTRRLPPDSSSPQRVEVGLSCRKRRPRIARRREVRRGALCRRCRTTRRTRPAPGWRGSASSSGRGSGGRRRARGGCGWHQSPVVERRGHGASLVRARRQRRRRRVDRAARARTAVGVGGHADRRRAARAAEAGIGSGRVWAEVRAAAADCRARPAYWWSPRARGHHRPRWSWRRSARGRRLGGTATRRGSGGRDFGGAGGGAAGARPGGRRALPARGRCPAAGWAADGGGVRSAGRHGPDWGGAGARGGLPDGRCLAPRSAARAVPCAARG